MSIVISDPPPVDSPPVGILRSITWDENVSTVSFNLSQRDSEPAMMVGSCLDKSQVRPHKTVLFVSFSAVVFKFLYSYPSDTLEEMDEPS